MSEKYNRVNWAVSILVASLSALPLGAAAAGLGKLTVLSALGQPLRAELDVSASRDEMTSLSAKVAAPEAFRQANIEYSGNFSTLRFTLDKRPNGQPYFKLTSDRAISDPFMDVLIELNWPAGRLMREYTFLLDPPESQPAESVASPVTRPTVVPATAAVPRDVRKPEPAPPRSKATPKVSDEAAAPAKSRSAETKDVATDGSTRVVKSGDTLMKIAAETKPADVNLDQMLVALFRANPDAFDRGNMNRLRAGKILALPASTAVAEITPTEARKEVRAHSGDFDAYKRKLAGMAAGTGGSDEVAVPSASGRITPKVEEKAPVQASKDKLEVSRTETAKSAAAGKSKAAEENTVARDKEIKDAQSRIAELEKNVAEMKRLVELKNQAAADLQKNAKPAEVAKVAPTPVAPPPAAAPVVKAPEPPKAVEAAKEAPKPVEPPKVDVAAAPAAPVQAPPTEAKPVEAPKPVPKPKPVVAAPPEPEEEPSFIEENLPMVAGGGGVLALLAGYFGFKAWRRRKGEIESSSSLAESALAGSSVFTAATSGHGGITDLTGQVSEFGPMVEGFGAGEGVDPVREAETYLAYGRDVQAEEILLDALKRDPGQPAVHLKLLEIYAARKSVPEFNTIAAELRSFTGGHGVDWDKALVLGREIDPSNPLYNADASAPAEVETTSRYVQVGAPSEIIEPAAEPAKPAADIATRTVVIPAPGGIAAALEKMSVPVAEEPQTEDETPDKLDFDLDLSSTDISGQVGEVSQESVAAQDISFDLDLGEPDSGLESEPAVSAIPVQDVGDIDFDILAEPTDAATAASDALAAEVGNAVDFDLALPDVVSDVVEAAPVESANGLDFNFDLGEPVSAAVAQVDSPSGQEDASLAETLIVDSPKFGAAASDLSLEETFIVDSIQAAPQNHQGQDISLEETLIAAPAMPDALPDDMALEDTLIVPDAPVAESAPLSSLPAEFADIDLELTDTLVMPAAELTDAKSMAPTHEIEAENPEAATKLELAQAYEEMGDKEGARELLQEVMAEGSSAQRATAQDRLARLD